MNAVLNCNFSGLEYDQISSLNMRSTDSVISTFDIELLKSGMNAIDLRIRNEITEKVLELKNLGLNWDSYDADAVSEHAIINAYHFISKMMNDGTCFLKRPVVSPEPDGGVLLKWKWNDRDLLYWFKADGLSYVYVENLSGERSGNKVDSIDDLLKIFKKWQSG